MLVLFQMRAPL